MNVKKNDNVLVIAGKDKDKTGKVIACFPKTHRVTVEGINIVTKHQKPQGQVTQGGRIQKVMPIDVSNVMVICPKCNKATRVAHKVNRVTNDEGKSVRQMVRVCKKCGAEID
ncbi:MAG: 50S ribosomal protein L24 [Clostridia bacterium]|nr:50S ribosomal protein L24 [Clostridia bacterium]